MLGRKGMVRLRIGRLARAGLWTIVGLAAASLPATTAWTQEPAGGPGATPGIRLGGASSPAAGRDERPGQAAQATGDKESMEPDMGLQEAREHVELLEAQVGAKQAKIRVAEALLKQAQDNLNLAQRPTRGSSAADEEKVTTARNDISIKQALLDAERAELRDPELRLSWAKRHLRDIERQAGAGNDAAGMGATDVSLLHMAHMAHLGISPEWMAIIEINRKLELMKGAMIRLEDEMDGILGTAKADASTSTSTKK
jgi:hypothetical protein